MLKNTFLFSDRFREKSYLYSPTPSQKSKVKSQKFFFLIELIDAARILDIS
jgi:hypothetical protein